MKKVLIIGSSSGIGYASAGLFKQKGWAVYGAARETAAEHNNNGARFDTEIVFDVAGGGDLSGFAKECGGFDAVIYSAGCGLASPCAYTPENEARYLFEVDFFGFVKTAARLSPFIAQGGSLIVIGSLASSAPVPYQGFYAAAKAALNMYTLNLRAEMKDKDVNACCILPGGVRTAFSFKRKVISTGDPHVIPAAEYLKNMEQNGLDPMKVAKAVYKAAVKKNAAPFIVPGFKNKLIYFILRFIPARLKVKLLRKR